MGLNDPLVLQYLRFVGHALVGDLGESIRFRNAVSALILERFSFTIELALAGMACALVIGLPLGMIAAVRANGWVDSLAMSLAYAGASMPVFWLGLVMILVFSFTLGWLPAAGAEEWRS